MPNEQDSAALNWSKQNPNDPRSKDIQAKIWSLQNPDDPRSSQILDMISKKHATPPEAPSNPFQTSNNQDEAVKQQTGQNPLQSFLAKAEAGVHTMTNSSPGLAQTASQLDQATSPQGINDIASRALLPQMGGIAAAGGGMLKRLLVGAGIGAAQNPDQPLTGAAGGAAVGGALEGANALMGGASRIGDLLKKAYQMSTGSPALQGEARDMIGKTVQSLRNSQVKTDLNTMLDKAQVEINPSDYLGKTPAVDQALRNKIAEISPYGTIPDKLSISGTDLNSIRQDLDKSIPWKSLPYGSLSKQDVETGQGIEQAANKARGLLHSISPELSDAFDSVHSNLQGANLLEKNSANPLTALKSNNPDKMANMTSLGDKAGSDLGDYSSQIRSAAKLSKHPVTSSPQILKQGLSGVKSALSSDSTPINDPRSLSAILNLIK